MEVPLPWERLLWSGRSWTVGGPRYALTDFRLVQLDGPRSVEIALCDIRDVQSRRSLADRIFGTATLVVRARQGPVTSLVLHSVRDAFQLRGVLQILAGEAPPSLDPDTVREALRWNPRHARDGARRGVLMGSGVLIAMFGIVIGVQGKPSAVMYPADDAIYPGGVKRDAGSIVHFMDDEVLPWARTALGPMVGGADRVTCRTCHGADPDARNWAMPAVGALPQPDVMDRGWEQYSSSMDAQMRNAIYGYIAESDNQASAAHMRDTVMPGMARLLRRPAYDFTRSYEYNRTQFAFGCYHCHQVK